MKLTEKYGMSQCMKKIPSALRLVKWTRAHWKTCQVIGNRTEKQNTPSKEYPDNFFVLCVISDSFPSPTSLLACVYTGAWNNQAPAQTENEEHRARRSWNASAYLYRQKQRGMLHISIRYTLFSLCMVAGKKSIRKTITIWMHKKSQATGSLAWFVFCSQFQKNHNGYLLLSLPCCLCFYADLGRLFCSRSQAWMHGRLSVASCLPDRAKLQLSVNRRTTKFRFHCPH